MVPAPLSQQLDELTDLLGQLADTAAGTMQRATAALLESRVRLAEQAFASDLTVRELRDRVEDLAGDALLFHAPVAGDLRAVVSAIRGAGDIARMNDLALHVADVVRMRAPQSAVPEEVREDFRQMGGVAVQLAQKAAEVLRSRNVFMAKELDADDDVIDDIHARMFGVLMDPSWPHGVTRAVDITLLARYYERFADHAVVIAHQTIYAVTGFEPEAIPI